MEDFNLVLRELINKDIEKINLDLPQDIIIEFEKTADNYLNKYMTLEAIKVFAITNNVDKLNIIGNDCILKDKPDLALKAFYYSKNKGGLSKTGMEFLKLGEIENGLIAFKLANDQEMIDFITKNF